MISLNITNTKICILFLLLFYISCSKDNKNSAIPYTDVNITIYTSDPDFIDLNAVGGWTSVTGGLRGIIIYRYSNNEFKAYERDCPYNPNDPCALISVEVNDIIASCSCCGSRFQLSDGDVIQGPSSYPMKEYQTSWDGNALHIFN